MFRRSGRSRRVRLLLGVAATAGLLAGGLVAPAGAAEPVDEAPEVIVNGDFSAGTAPWWSTANSPVAVSDGRLCADVPAGTANAWDAIVGQSGLALTAGEGYTLSYTATSTVPVTIRANVQRATEPWTTELATAQPVGTTAERVTETFTAGADHEAAQLVFQIGGGAEALTFCVDDVSLRGGTAPPPYEPDTGSPVRVNQVGYLTHGPKGGTFVTGETGPQVWTLDSADGTRLAGGTTTPASVDTASRQHVHTFDFSAVTTPGEGYTVTVAGEKSEPFAIGDDLYASLRTDALAYFHHNRSGIEIDADIVGEQYARPAGHLGVSPNQGDNDVPCQPGVCDYRLNAAGGWYDAGDHGKYVVNGGISVAQLMSTFERTLYEENADAGPLGDGALRLPEHGNATPDILDEARWELEFLMRMQVPAGKPLAGMAHHKLHDKEWTGLPTRPDRDPQPRELHPPTTAATLNLAATAAQCARLFQVYDAGFAAQCREAARTAWTAAKAHPDILADPQDGTGGGAYNDNDVRDEFYWAAAELYLTTGEDAYRQEVLRSPLHGDTDAVFPRGGMSWGSVAGLGALNLSTVPGKLSADQLTTVRGMVTEAADGYAADSARAAYGLPYAPDDGHFVWGSNSQVANNMVVLGSAHDLTGRTAYRDAVLRGMDYLLGRNALNQSYITGYGERDSRNQHHRFWANQLDPALPHPAPGSLAGGPNDAIQDPVAQAELRGCAPSMCYIDDIESWSTNEITINWNAPLAWVASYVDDLGSGAPARARCEVTYTSHRWDGGFTTQVVVKNTGALTIRPWRLDWTFADQQRVTDTWGADVRQSGPRTTAEALGWNLTLAPGGTVRFGFNGRSTGLVNDPRAFRLNDRACGTTS
ncbi:glycoside hydrolase family 9 protein [Streptomyces sp. 24-1644]|uniref:glycoside hydrolase family 9 protein n=1 Tax=Streptomyces sp. 24-1644 TaxID=3457315 RepID=UPI003FA76EFC